MKYRTQVHAVEKMEKETRRAMRGLEDSHANKLLMLWVKTTIELQSVVAREYRQDFPGKDPEGAPERWHLAAAGARGTLYRIFEGTGSCLNQFSRQAKEIISKGLQDNFRQEILRQAWMLDATTPPKRGVRLPLAITREADAPRDYQTGWSDALDAWLQSYQDGLRASLRMEAVHEGGLEDATQEVLKTKVDGSDLTARLNALFANQALQAQQDARDEFVGANDDLVLEEIWMTMEDVRVCPICDAYDGKPYEEVDDEIPAHFNCRCYTRIVPAAWAELLRSGDPEERELALKMDDAGLIPSSMAIKGEDGELKAQISVAFDDWLGSRALEMYGQNVAGMAGADQVR